MKPTDEQVAAADAFRAGQHLALQAGAGTGKTSTLALLAAATPRRGRYLAFSKDIATAATSRFPRTVTCKTTHALAFAATGHRYLPRLNGPRQSGWRAGRALGITQPLRIGDHDITPAALSYAALHAVTRFCHSADPVITRRHIPQLRGLEGQGYTQLADAVLPFAHKAWADLQHPEHGAVSFGHDHYLKIWALTEPKIDADYLLLDEAQDTNPVVEQAFNAQRAHAQLVMVGDSAQAIYGWRGAKDVMTGFNGTPLTLSRSFRFGPRLAAEANRWLTIADAPIRLQGSDTVPTELTDVPQPDAILCRTNVGTITHVMNLLDTGHRVALAGGGKSLQALAHAARALKDGRPTRHPELILFRSWGELQDYADRDPTGGDLKPLVDLIDQHGADAILTAIGHLVDEHHAQVTVTTAHKAKGREWPNVRIADDFHPPKDSEEKDDQGRPLPGPIDDTEARLAYVAVTRARHRLERGSLSWIDHHPAGNTDTD
ncbi:MULTISPECIES: UvrD-helicase domain-containing protein [unclassified Streptomyces]|uniref:UvrD-helicase domain-containing protein n=1 Tax=unclassified Streptomyces TaxID=2593676 RepID=UPI002E0F645D|nr:UvrD-helicase domain-containing protein [Streptomyces sp. NBC_01197]WSR73592.1 UvrD-helicase domain-containing protein [Streptomyces sp. NBC_01197]WSS53382.1 UvrD-helicase domain-containing protein [Streptomyces sp. NBC_01180]WSS53844.1 UvrD-helicase domain-containing protein [Streptomyces sp. NBC_01180]